MCIGQANVPERNRQVTLMSRIYLQATSVVIYLSYAEHDSGTAVDFLIDNESPVGEVSQGRTDQLPRSLNCYSTGRSSAVSRYFRKSPFREMPSHIAETRRSLGLPLRPLTTGT